MVPKECQSMVARSGNTSLFRLNSIRACSLVSGELSSCIQVYTCSRFSDARLFTFVTLVAVELRWFAELAILVVRVELLVPPPATPMELGGAMGVVFV